MRRDHQGPAVCLFPSAFVALAMLLAPPAWSASRGQNSAQAQPAPKQVATNNSTSTAPAAQLGPPAITIPRLQRAPSLDDFLSMQPQGETALQMAKITGFTQRNPYDGQAVSEPTDAYLGYDQKNLYAIFVCFDDPKQIRARMSVREDIYDDDQVEVILDTFHDRRRAYAFQTTPLGVQWDAIWTEASREEQTSGHFDTSFDTVWDSHGKLTAKGFVVLIAIPFKSLRFPAKKVQEWGIILYRGITRKNEDSFWPYVSRKIEGRLGQAATLYGLEGISPGRDVELIPYGLMRGYRALDTTDPSNPYFQNAVAQGQSGMDAKFVFHDHFTLDLTANPDYSQIESEDPQITVNQRYAVYFPEKRPFFLENEDFFRTPMDLFFTRNIGDPSAGARLTGKDGPYSLGVITSDDRSPGLAVPSGCLATSIDCSSALSGVRSYFTIAHVTRDIFRQSTIGALYTDWECPSTHEFNRIGGVDSRMKFNQNWTLDSQAVISSSNVLGNPISPNYSANNCETYLTPFSSGSVGDGNHYAGPADRLELRRDGLHLTYDGTYYDVSPGFVSIPGFINRTDIRETYQELDYRFRPKHGWVQAWGPSINSRFDFDHNGLRLDTFYAPYLSISGKGHTVIHIRPYTESRERLRPQDFCFLGFTTYCPPALLRGNEDYHERQAGATFETRYLKKATIAGSYFWGDGPNFVAEPYTAEGLPFHFGPGPTPYNQPFLAREDQAAATVNLRPMKPLKIENSYLFERLRANNATYEFESALYPGIGRSIFSDHIFRTKWNWQFTPQLSFRMILQYNDLLAGTPIPQTGLSSSPYTYLPTAKDFNADFLITYLVHPGTAVYVGYNSDLQNLNIQQATAANPGAVTNTAKGYLNDSRQFFVKVSYLFRF